MITNIKKCIKCFLMTAAAAAVFALPAAADTENKDLAASAQFTLPNGFEYSTDIIAQGNKNIDENDGQSVNGKQYSFVFPYYAQEQEITLNFSNIDLMYKDGVQYTDTGRYIMEEGEYTALAYGKEYPVIIKYTSDIYQVYLALEEGIDSLEVDKNKRIKGEIVITNGITTEYSGGLEYITGRGNSTWMVRKKPYSIKLSSKTGLFDMGASRKYALKALYTDNSMVRDAIALKLGEEAGIKYNPKGRFVDLYVDGEYRGLYYLSEKIEVSRSRINIQDLDYVNEQLNPGVNLKELERLGETSEDANKIKGGYKWIDIPNDIAANLGGGYLLEHDIGSRYDDANAGFVSDYGQPVVIKSPEYASKGQVEYIREYYQQFEDALLSDDGYNSLGKHYSDYIDVESFAKMYVFQEYALNQDAARSSSFMYKEINGKLTMCTVWDLDRGFGFDGMMRDVNLKDPQSIGATISTRDRKKEECIFALLCQHAEFRRMAAKCWEENFAPHIQSVIEESEIQEALVRDSVETNYLRWIRERIGFEDFISENIWVREFLQLRAEFMSEFMSPDAVYVSYKRNGADGAMLDKYSYMPGDKATVLENEFDGGDAQFLGWNTAADGSGTAYMPGDVIGIEGEDVVLYAQWDGISAEAETTPIKANLFTVLTGWLQKIFR